MTILNNRLAKLNSFNVVVNSFSFDLKIGNVIIASENKCGLLMVLGLITNCLL